MNLFAKISRLQLEPYKWFNLSVFLAFIIVASLSCKKEDSDDDLPETDTVADIEGNTYQTVKIGNQWWMAENLRTNLLSDSTAIQFVSNTSTWIGFSNPAFCWYDNNFNVFGSKYGALYNWHAVNTGKLCPDGWRVPGNNDWLILTNHLGGDEIAAGKLKETGTTNWISPNTGATNESGFTALPGGVRGSDGTFFSIGLYGYWWTTNSQSAGLADGKFIYYAGIGVGKDQYDKKTGFSVRCVKE